jgi:hypothetical protein
MILLSGLDDFHTSGAQYGAVPQKLWCHTLRRPAAVSKTVRVGAAVEEQRWGAPVPVEAGLLALLEDGGQPEVHELGAPVGREHDVVRLYGPAVVSVSIGVGFIGVNHGS